MPEQMEMTKLSTKGQIVLPLRIRNSRAWNTGTEFTVEEMGDGILLRPILARCRPPVSIWSRAACTTKASRKRWRKCGAPLRSRLRSDINSAVHDRSRYQRCDPATDSR